MNKTKIEWADATWNPVTGCLHGCEYCYARRIANRFGGHVYGEARYATAPDGQQFIELEKPAKRLKKNGEEAVAPFPFYFKPTLHRYRLDEPQRWKKPRNIFVCSMADLFGEWVPEEWIKAVFDACEKAPQHRYLFLTKNPWRYVELASTGKLPKRENMWYGTTATVGEHPIFKSTRCNTFVSIEPLLDASVLAQREEHIPEWVIIGAETGNRKGKVVPRKEWVDGICNVADMTGAAVFMKDSLIPVVGEDNMRREFPWDAF